jgi:hypothetical protein
MQAENPKLKIEGFDKEDITCTVCFEYMETQIFQCKAGHCLCEKCYREMTNDDLFEIKCPTCSVPIYTQIRCLSLENLYPFITLECKNEKHGCDFKGTHAQREEHLKTCEFKRVTCPRSSCDFEGTARELFLHWREKHISTQTVPHSYAENGNATKLCLVAENFKTSWINRQIILLYQEDNLITFDIIVRMERSEESDRLFQDLRIQPRILAKNPLTECMWTKCRMSLFYRKRGIIRKAIVSSELEDIDACPFTETSACDDLINANGACKIQFTISLHTGNKSLSEWDQETWPKRRKA